MFTNSSTTAPADEHLLDAIRHGNDVAFDQLVERHHSAMIRLARTYVSHSLAEEVAQETWIAIIKGLHRFEGRASFKTWMFRILMNRAFSHSSRESRGDFLFDDEAVAEQPVEGQWLVPSRSWTPEERLLGNETLDLIEDAIDSLPVMQRQVITLRDVEGWSAREVCDLYGITESNQRVLLHRARMKIRNMLETMVSREAA